MKPQEDSLGLNYEIQSSQICLKELVVYFFTSSFLSVQQSFVQLIYLSNTCVEDPYG